jgi:ribose 5-phosphate isomerase A
MTPDEPTEGAEYALRYVRDGGLVGLGTGRAATSFVRALAGRVRAGLAVRGVPTSAATASLAAELGIPLVSLEEAGELDVTVDGADEVDPRLDLIKGYGGALVREKIVAASSRRLVILVGKEKLVPVLGSRGLLPVEVVPFGEALCRRRLSMLGCRPERRVVDGKSFVTDNGNLVLDCGVKPIADAPALERAILDIPGVVGTGLFLRMADVVLAHGGGRVEVHRRAGAAEGEG